MKKSVAMNLVLIGILSGMCINWACSSEENGGAGDAEAQISCSQWEARVDPIQDESGAMATIPEGFEPFAATASFGHWVISRRCIAN